MVGGGSFDQGDRLLRARARGALIVEGTVAAALTAVGRRASGLNCVNAAAIVSVIALDSGRLFGLRPLDGGVAGTCELQFVCPSSTPPTGPPATQQREISSSGIFFAWPVVCCHTICVAHQSWSRRLWRGGSRGLIG
uniref:Uncharacterized protein n=1 Tax=Plectus sambesii TaxID=2011161 RepID=A0A914W4T6_9BILA